MEALLIVHCKMTSFKVAEFINAYDGNSMAMLIDILAWTESTMQINTISWFDFSYVRHHFERYRFIVMLNESGWTARYKHDKFLNDATLFELKVTFSANPFYPFLAFAVPFDACENLARLHSISIHPNVYAYAVVTSMVRATRKVKAEDIQNTFQSLNIDSAIDVTKIYPCGMNVLDGHPFARINLSRTPPAALAEYVKHKGEIVSRIREKTNMINQLWRSVDGSITWKSDSIEFMRLVREINTPILL